LVADAGLDPSAPHYCVLHGNATRHIIEQEQEEDCDLIVLGKHGQSKFEELLLGSVTKHVLAESTCDVVVSALATS
jgi:nucleotide-binding universal stress UspA family protein